MGRAFACSLQPRFDPWHPTSDESDPLIQPGVLRSASVAPKLKKQTNKEEVFLVGSWASEEAL